MWNVTPYYTDWKKEVISYQHLWCGKDCLDNQCKHDFPGFLDKSRHQKVPGCKNSTITKIIISQFTKYKKIKKPTKNFRSHA